jgi:hypothetical protein
MSADQRTEIDTVPYKVNPRQTDKFIRGSIILPFVNNLAILISKFHGPVRMFDESDAPFGCMKGVAVKAVELKEVPNKIDFTFAVEIVSLPVMYPLYMGKTRFCNVFDLPNNFGPTVDVIVIITIN